MGDRFAAHRQVLERAVQAIRARGYWSAFPEAPSGKIYGETAKADAAAAFKALLNRPFALDAAHPADAGRAGEERSPYGFPLGITYPAARPDTLVTAAQAAGEGWARASVEERVGVCLEILHRLNRQSFLVAEAVMHTTGQAFVMAFQAGGRHRRHEAPAFCLLGTDGMMSPTRDGLAFASDNLLSSQQPAASWETRARWTRINRRSSSTPRFSMASRWCAGPGSRSST